jgi:hypothetical protein
VKGPSGKFTNRFGHDVVLLWVDAEGARAQSIAVEDGTTTTRQVGWGHRFIAARTDTAPALWSGIVPDETKGVETVEFVMKMDEMPPLKKGALRTKIQLTTTSGTDGKSTEMTYAVDVEKSGDVEEAVLRFVARVGMVKVDDFITIRRRVQATAAQVGFAFAPRRHLAAATKSADAAAAVALVAEKLKRGEWFAAAALLARARELDGDVAAKLPVVTSLWTATIGAMKAEDAALAAIDGDDWAGASRHFAAIDKALAAHTGVEALVLSSSTMLLRRAQVLAKQMKLSAVLRTCGRLLRGETHRGEWLASQSRTRAVFLGARAAIVVGDIKTAKKHLSIILKADPDQSRAKHIFAAVKKLGRFVDRAEKRIAKSCVPFSRMCLPAPHWSCSLGASLQPRRLGGSAATRRGIQCAAQCSALHSLTRARARCTHSD